MVVSVLRRELDEGEDSMSEIYPLRKEYVRRRRSVAEVTIKIKIPYNVKKALDSLCYIENPETGEAWKVDTLGALARECLVRGLYQVIEERKRMESQRSDESFGREKSYAADSARLKVLSSKLVKGG